MSSPECEASFSGGRLSRCSPIWKRAILVAVATFVIVVLLSFFFWPIPTETDQNEIEYGQRWLLHVETAKPEELNLDSLQEEIRTSIEQLLESYPRDPQSLHLAGIVYAELKQTVNAERMFLASLDIEPNEIQVRHDLAELLLMSGRDQEALEVLEIGRERGETPFAFVCLLAETQSRLGLIPEAVTTLQAALKNFPTAAKQWRILGELQLQQSNYALAETSLRKSIELDGQNEPAQFALCQSLALQKKSEEAIAARLRLDKLRTQNRAIQTSFEQVHQQTFRRFVCSTFRSIAILHQVHRELEKAKAAFDRAIQVDPTDLKTLSQMTNYYRKLGDYENAAEFSRKIVLLQPDELSHYTNLANLCMEAGNASIAQATLQLAANRNVGGGISHQLLARFLMLRNKAAEAVPPARRAVELLETTDSYLVLIDALDASGKKDLAEAVRTQARKTYPNESRLKGNQK